LFFTLLAAKKDVARGLSRAVTALGCGVDAECLLPLRGGDQNDGKCKTSECELRSGRNDLGQKAGICSRKTEKKEKRRKIIVPKNARLRHASFVVSAALAPARGVARRRPCNRARQSPYEAYVVLTSYQTKRSCSLCPASCVPDDRKPSPSSDVPFYPRPNAHVRARKFEVLGKKQ
jgi:hypothetical protein